MKKLLLCNLFICLLLVSCANTTNAVPTTSYENYRKDLTSADWKTKGYISNDYSKEAIRAIEEYQQLNLSTMDINLIQRTTSKLFSDYPELLIPMESVPDTYIHVGDYVLYATVFMQGGSGKRFVFCPDVPTNINIDYYKDIDEELSKGGRNYSIKDCTISNVEKCERGYTFVITHPTEKLKMLCNGLHQFSIAQILS